MLRKSKWSSHDTYIFKNISKFKQIELAYLLGTTPSNLSHRLQRLGVSKKRKKISPQEHSSYFKSNAMKKTRKQMAIELGVSERTIARCLKSLGISTRKRKIR